MHRTMFVFLVLSSCSGGSPSQDVRPEARTSDVPADPAVELPTDVAEELRPDISDPSPDLPDSDFVRAPDTTDVLDAADAVAEAVDIPLEADVQTAVGPAHVWSQSFGGSGAEEGVSVAVNSEGRIFLAGNYHSETLNLGGEPLQNQSTMGMRDAFVAAFAPDGSHLWSKGFGGADDDVMYSLALSDAGEVHLTGFFRSDFVDFGAGPVAGAGKMDVFVVKLSGDGDLVWARTFGGEIDDAAFSVAVDSAGDAYLVGYFSSPFLELGGEPLENVSIPGYHDIFVARFDQNGEHVWSRRFGGASWEFGRAVSIMGDALYVGGRFYSPTMEAGDEMLENQGDADFFVLKLDLGGDTSWARQYGGPLHDACHALAAGPGGGVYVTGTSKSHVLDLGGGPLPHVGSENTHDMFVFGLSPEGEHLWSHAYGAFSWEMGRSLSVDQAGAVYVTGAFYSQELDFGGVPLAPAGPGEGEAELFVLKLSQDGGHVWSEKFGGPKNDFGHAVAVAPSGEVVLAGGFNGGEGEGTGPLDFGGGPLPEWNAFDIFLAKLKLH